MANLNFDATNVAPSTPFEPVPAGWYNVMIDESSVEPTKNGEGTLLKLRLNVIDGDCANRKIFARLNIRNQNPVAQEIAQQQLSAICHATGTIRVQDSQELHGKPFQVRVTVKAADQEKGYDAQNEVKGFKPVEGAAPAPVGGSSSAPAGVPSWAQSAPTPPPPPAPVAPPPPPPAVFPPEGWVAHPTAPGYFYKGNEVLSETDLRKKYAPPPTAPTAPVPPPPPPAASAAGAPPWAQQSGGEAPSSTPPWARK